MSDGTKPRYKGAEIGFLVIIVLIVIAFIVDSRSPSRGATRETYSADTKSRVSALINEAKKSGLIKKLDARNCKAWILEFTWESVDSQAKEGIARNLALFFAVQKDETYQDATILGWQSGRKLASYSSVGGFRVF